MSFNQEERREAEDNTRDMILNKKLHAGKKQLQLNEGHHMNKAKITAEYKTEVEILKEEVSDKRNEIVEYLKIQTLHFQGEITQKKGDN